MQREDKPSLILSFKTEPKQETLDSDYDSGAQCSLVDSEMTSVKLEDCSQTLGLNVIIKDEEEEEEIRDVSKHGRKVAILSDGMLRGVGTAIPEAYVWVHPGTTLQRTTHQHLHHFRNEYRTFLETISKVAEIQMEAKPSLMLSFHTEPVPETLDSDCDSGAQCSLVDSEMTSVKLEDCNQTLGLNVIIKDEEEEEEIGDVINHAGIPLETFPASGEEQQEDYKDNKFDHSHHYEKPFTPSMLKIHINTKRT
ncbi:hypothetical protein UPYG_G00159870 [Umbra pygmaea]|uniref:Uncharacterized protein n=1 Tax=Umbra pygmaea TaxID=75934 RepID=A0ABD0X337_UMBPY